MKRRSVADASRRAATPDADGASVLAAEVAAAIDHLRHERLDDAEPALHRILARWPEQPDALHFLGVLRHAQGRVDEAVDLIRRSLGVRADNAGAWNNLGNVLLLAQRADEAATAYARAVEFSGGEFNEAPSALNNLGVLYRKLDRLDDSERACRRALAFDPAFGDAWYNLSITLIRSGRVHDGLIAHGRAVAAWPEQLQSRQEVIRALLLLGENGRAAGLLREWLAADPGNPVAEHMLAASGGSAAAPARASDRYVQQVFDGFAASFDAKLEALHYRAPELVVQALADAVGAPAAALDIVDVGCGTGLCAQGLRPYARRLAGCDLSVGMLRRARARGLYDVLHQAELSYYLATQPAAWDAVVSADTLCYFGALDEALAAARRSLRAGGRLVFTVEALADGDAQPHRLQSNGRYAHERGYLERCLRDAGFERVRMRRETLRLEAGVAVPGWLVGGRLPS
ncbi:MAG: tetratricopeptide repeat protein [Burkholderiales bacterium]|nr:tetratricopeptide repeat protein [Burkholderiales bacterium]